MNRQEKDRAGTAMIMGVALVLLLVPVTAMAGSLDPSGPPYDGTMKTLQDIYDKADEAASKAEKAEVLYNAFNKAPGEVCSGTTYLGLRPDGTIGEMTGMATCGTCYRDTDGDGYGDPDELIDECVGLPAGYVWTGGDCDENDTNVNPGKQEVCRNGIDDNCDPSDCRTATLFPADYTNGNFGNRGGANMKCNESPYKPAGTAIAVPFYSDYYISIKDIPANIGVKIDYPVRGSCTVGCSIGGEVISDSWEGLWDGNIDNSLYAAGVLHGEERWWSGSTSSGWNEYCEFRPPCDHDCGDWSHAIANQMASVGSSTETGEGWINIGFNMCDGKAWLVCVAFDGGRQ